MVAQRLGGKGEAHDVRPVFGAVVLARADEGFQFDLPARFLQRFAPRRLEQALAGFQVTGRLVETHLAAHVFFHDQEAVAVVHHARDGHVRAPDVFAGRIEWSHSKAACKKSERPHRHPPRSFWPWWPGPDPARGDARNRPILPSPAGAASRFAAQRAAYTRNQDNQKPSNGANPTKRPRIRPRTWPGRRDGEAGDGAAAAVPGGAAQRRLHADGVRGGGPGNLLQHEPRESDPDHVARAYARERRLRRVHARSCRKQGNAGERVLTQPSTSLAVHYGKTLSAPISKSAGFSRKALKRDQDVQQRSRVHHRPVLQGSARAAS